MKFSLLAICFLAVVCLSLSEAAEESRGLNQNSKHKLNIIMDRETRSAGRKAKKEGRKTKKKAGRRNKTKTGRKNENKARKVDEKKSRRINRKKAGRKNGKKAGRKPGKKGGRKSGKKFNKEPTIEGKKTEEKTQRKLIHTATGDKRSIGRANLVGSHCEFVDLCVIDRMSESGCNMGDKFVIKSPRGIRRQFLMVDGSKIIAFLKNGKKITDCPGNLTDVTNKVTCKAVAGAGTLKLQRQNSTNETTTVASPALDTSPATDEAPTTAPGPTTAEAPMTDAMPPLQAGQFHCPCPTRTCLTTITSTNNMHKIQCGSKTFNVPCGGPLKGSKIGLLISIIDVFEQPLCSTNTYVTLIKDLVWKCSDLNIPEDAPCDATTAAAGTTGPDSSDASMGATPAPDTTGPDSSMGAITTGATDGNATAAPATTPSTDSVTTIVSGTTTTPSGTTTTASGTTTTASGTTTTASGTTTTASGTTTTASVTTTTTASVTTTTTASVTTTTTT